MLAEEIERARVITDGVACDLCDEVGARGSGDTDGGCQHVNTLLVREITALAVLDTINGTLVKVCADDPVARVPKVTRACEGGLGVDTRGRGRAVVRLCDTLIICHTEVEDEWSVRESAGSSIRACVFRKHENTCVRTRA